jgi:hypothetical protein
MRAPGRTCALAALAVLLFLRAASSANEGTSGGVTLTFPSGARAQAMAEAYTVSAGDVNGVFYNPATVARADSTEAAAFYGRGYFDDTYGGLAYVQPAGPGALAASFNYYTTGDMQLDDGENVRTVRGMSDYLLGLSYAAPLNEAIGLGGTVKVLRSTLVEDFPATAVAADLGLTYRVGKSSVLLGAAITNLGSEIRYRDSGAPLPWAFGLGALIRGTLLNSPATASGDVLRAREGDLKGRLGFEVRPGGLLAVRVGYKLGYDSDSFAVGLGVRVKKLDVNYAAGIASGLSSIHLVELAYTF